MALKLFKGYDYPLYHRISEILGIIFFIAYSFLLIMDITPVIYEASTVNKLIFIFAIPCLSFITADFMSGLVHFLCDNFGSPKTPYLGPSFIKSFRDHHTDPKGITRHDFIEVNGSNCIISLPFLAMAYHTFDYANSFWMLSFTIFLLFMLMFVFLTNQFHKWAHQENAPALVKYLQRFNLILSPEHHSVHHKEPYDKYYCITCGWLNPFLSRIKFFEGSEALLRWIFNSPKGMEEEKMNEFTNKTRI